MFYFGLRISLLTISILVLISICAVGIMTVTAESESKSKVLKNVDDIAKGAYKTSGSIVDFVGLIIRTAISVLGVIFLVLIVYAGYMWMTSSGNEEQVKSAKHILTNSTIGLVIVLASYIISYFVLSNIRTETLAPAATPSKESGSAPAGVFNC